MSLPFEPETEEMLGRRFKEATSQIYEIEDIQSEKVNVEDMRKHVFDYEFSNGKTHDLQSWDESER